jgi:hypothetical protein
MLALEIPIGTVPLFVTVTVWVADAVPTGVEKVNDLGEKAISGSAPVPCTSIVELKPLATSVTLIPPFLTPVVDGVNTILTVQLPLHLERDGTNSAEASSVEAAVRRIESFSGA